MGLTGVPSTDRAEHGSWCCRRLVAHDTTSFIPSSVNRLDSTRLVTVPTYSEIFDERASTESGRQKCDYCKDCLLTSEALEDIEMDSSLTYSAARVNRGGLSRATDYYFLLTVRCWRVFEEN